MDIIVLTLRINVCSYLLCMMVFPGVTMETKTPPRVETAVSGIDLVAK